MSGARLSRVAVVLVAAAALAFTTTRSLVAEGNRALEEGRAKAAVEAYQKALERAPGTPEILFDLGLAEARAGDPAAGRDHLQAALTTGGEPLRPAIEYNVGNTYLAQQRWAEAAHAFEAALRADPTNRDAKANLELARRKLKEEQEKKKKEQQAKKKGDNKKDERQKKKKKDKQKKGEDRQGEKGDKGEKKGPEAGQEKEGQNNREQEKREKKEKGSQGKRADKEGAKGGAPAGQKGEKEKREGRPGERRASPRRGEPSTLPQGGGTAKKGGMDPAQAADLLKALQRQEGEVQRQVRARLVPVAPHRRAQDW